MKNDENLIENVALYLSKIPGVGFKNSRRYAFWLAEHNDQLRDLITSLTKLADNITLCKSCFNLTTNKDGVCDICKDTSRDKTICVVESIENLLDIENSKVYNGYYFVLGGVISPMYGIDQVIQRIDYLAKKVENGDIKEIILVLSSTTEGDLTSQYIKEKLKFTNVKVSKVASGIPVGVNINYIDKRTLIEAFKARVYA